MVAAGQLGTLLTDAPTPTPHPTAATTFVFVFFVHDGTEAIKSLARVGKGFAQTVSLTWVREWD